MKLLKLLSAGATLLGSVSSSYIHSQHDNLPWRYGSSDQQPNTPTSMYEKNQEGTVLSLKFDIDKYDDGAVYDQKTGKKIGYVHLDCEDSCIVKNDVNTCKDQCNIKNDDVMSCEIELEGCNVTCTAECSPCCMDEKKTCDTDCKIANGKCTARCTVGDEQCRSECKTETGVCDDDECKVCMAQCTTGVEQCNSDCKTVNDVCDAECKDANTKCQKTCLGERCESDCSQCETAANICFANCDEANIRCLGPCVEDCLRTEPGEVNECSLKFETTRGNFDIGGNFESLKTLISEKDSCQVSGECEFEACLNCKSGSGITTKYDSKTRSRYELEVLSLFGTTCTNSDAIVKKEPTFFVDVEFGKEKYRSLKHSGYNYNNQPQPQYGYQKPMTYSSYQQPITYPQQAPISPHYGGQQQTYNAHQQWQYVPAQPQYQQQSSGHYVNHVQPVYTQQQPFQHQPVGSNNYQSGYSNQQQYVPIYQPATYGK